MSDVFWSDASVLQRLLACLDCQPHADVTEMNIQVRNGGWFGFCNDASVRIYDRSAGLDVGPFVDCEELLETIDCCELDSCIFVAGWLAPFAFRVVISSGKGIQIVRTDEMIWVLAP